MSAHSHDDQEPLDSSPALSGEAITPRGGFMARPGLKTPPRHAVVVRGGDAPESEHIPRLRSSLPPPPPSEPVVSSNDEKVTLRAIPTPPAPRVAEVAPASESLVPSPPAATESLPPPSQGPLSDAPLVASLPPPQPQRPSNSRWTIVAAAAAGLVLGLASVAAKVQTQGAAAQPPSDASLPLAPSVGHAPTPVPSSRALAKTPAPAPVVSAERAASEPKASRPAPPSAKRSIF
jgi:hypothetical protein